MCIKCDDKTGVIYRKWKVSQPRAVLLLVHGLGAHSERWKFLSEYFLRNNISSYALELKGFGETGELRGDIDSFKSYLKDVFSLYGIIKNENPAKKIFVLGESLGALIAFLAAIENPRLFNGLICISPAFKNRLKFTASDYIKILISFFFNPQRQFTVPFNSAMCTRDTGYQEAMEKDPREHRLATSRLLMDIGLAQLKAAILKNRINSPVLFLIAGNEDKLVDPEASKKIFGRLKTADRELIQYPDMRHALSIELGREKVFADILKWIENRL